MGTGGIEATCPGKKSTYFLIRIYDEGNDIDHGKSLLNTQPFSAFKTASFQNSLAVGGLHSSTKPVRSFPFNICGCF